MKAFLWRGGVALVGALALVVLVFILLQFVLSQPKEQISEPASIPAADV